ncbi:MAG: ATP-dependent Clp protease ATP-binding subunit [Patescibacteria group bacterium]|nr:ATP-dependent Clp protease ATP-binding subunit [Patescibacteria group bacterium]
MNSEKNKNQEMQFIKCPKCQGQSYYIDKKGKAVPCAACDSLGVAAYFKGRYLIWQKRITHLRILEEKTEKMVRAGINGLLIAFGILGLFLGFWQLYQHASAGYGLTHLFEIRNTSLLIFWISLLVDMYIYYRLERERTRVPHIERDFVEKVPLPENLINFKEVLDNKKIRQEVSNYLNSSAMETIEKAWELADRLGHTTLEPIHVLAAVISSSEVKIIMARLAMMPDQLIKRIKNALGKLPKIKGSDTIISQDFNKMVYLAYQEAYQGRRSTIGVPDLIIALARTGTLTQEILYDLEISFDKLRNVVEWINIEEKLRHKWTLFKAKASRKPKRGMNRAMTAIATPVLDQFSRDLTTLASQGALPLSVGREKEVKEIFRILESGKNYPLLVGFPGVGKTSIIHNIASMMASEEVPEILRDKRLVSLSVSSLVSGAGAMGELEERLSAIISEVVRSGNIVLFIDNLQNMVGVSSGGGKTMDISEILTEALQKGYFAALASTNPIDYSRYIERHGGISSIFQSVKIEEPETNEAIKILESKAGMIEVKNKVFFSYEALEKAVKLSQRYIHDRYLPEKAINLIQEVAVHVRKTKGPKNPVKSEDVAKIVSERANVQVTKITEKESEKLLNLEKRIHERIINQEEAVNSVSGALRRARVELRDIQRPIANLLFLGPTGVGKTELAKTVAEVYFGSEENMIRLDMSEYQDQSSISRILGASPGYTGSGSGGYLTEAVRKNPFSLVLLDELEKSHPDVLNLFLQLMDDGRLTDSLGRTVDFTNIILIATSNAGTEHIQRRLAQKTSMDEIKKELMEEVLFRFFRPEFINRFDNVILFKPLSMEHIEKIVGLFLKNVQKRLTDKGITLQASKEAIKELAKEGYDPIYGARPLKRKIQEIVDNALANYLLKGELSRRDVAILEPGGRIKVKKAKQL